jgi:hypothetical protein
MTRDPLPEDEDARLAILFRPAAAPVPDDGFSDAVMRRVALRAWRRRALLGAAAAAGLVVADGPGWEALAALGPAISSAAARAAGLGGLLSTQAALAAGLVVLVAPGLWRWLEE